MPPTHSVAFQIKDKSVLKRVDRVLHAIKEKSPGDVARSVVATEKSHVSLFVFELPRQREREAVMAFKSVAARHRETFQAKPVSLELKGVDQMCLNDGHRLVFSPGKIKPPGRHSQVVALVQELKEEFAKIEGARINRTSSLFLHLSLVNTSIGGGAPPKDEIPSEWFQDCKDFGEQKVFSVQLLSKHKNMDSDGYYYCEAEVMF